MISPNYRRSGFTLTEALVASTLLVIAMIPILRGLTGANLSAAIIEQKSRSLSLAQAEMQRLTAQSIYNYGVSLAQSNAVLEGSYLCNVSDTVVSSDLRQIAVSVGYDANGNSTLSASETAVTLTTQLARRW